MNIPYEMFLTIQMHLTCRKYAIHNHLQEKKNEDLTSDDSSKTKNNMMSAVTSLMQNLLATKKERKTSSRRTMSRMQYQYMKGSSQFHHAVDGDIMGYKEIFVAQGFVRKEGIDYEEIFVSNGS